MISALFKLVCWVRGHAVQWVDTDETFKVYGLVRHFQRCECRRCGEVIVP